MSSVRKSMQAEPVQSSREETVEEQQPAAEVPTAEPEPEPSQETTEASDAPAE